MANYQYASDLINAALFAVGEPTDGTSDFEAKALDYLNRTYQAIWMGGAAIAPEVQEDWWWLRKSPPGVLTLLPAISDGTVAVTNNNTTITFSSAPSRDLDGWFFKVDDHDDVFRISAHTSGQTAATLDSVYTGDTAAAAAYRAFKLEYDLAPDVLRIIAPMRVYRAEREYEIAGTDLTTLDRDYPLALVESGVPDRFAMVDEHTVRFNRSGGTASTDLIRVEYDYLYTPSDLTDAEVEPVVPRQFRHILADYVQYLLMVDKNDDRANEAAARARNGLLTMMRENRKKLGAMGRGMVALIRPRQDDYAWQSRRPVRTANGLIIG